MAAAIAGAALSGAGGGSGYEGLLGNSLFGSPGSSQNVNSKTTGSTTSLSDPEIQALNALIGNLTSSNNQYSRDNAIADSQGFAQKALLQLQQVGLPGIASQQKTAGEYNGTGATELAQNLEAQTSADIAANTSQTVANYANIVNQNNSVLAQLYAVLKGASTTSNSTTNTTQSTAATPGLIGNNGQTGLGNLANGNFGKGIEGLFGL